MAPLSHVMVAKESVYNLNMEKKMINNLKNKKVLVTGGTGMIGRYLVDKLLAKNCKVTVVSLDSPDGLPSEVEFKRLDLTVLDNCLEACEDQDLWRRMALTHNFEYIDEELVCIRWHARNMQKRSMHMVNANLQFLEKLKNETPLLYRYHLPDVAYKIYFNSILSLIEAEHLTTAFSILVKIVQISPTHSIRFLKDFLFFILRALKRLIFSKSTEIK